MPTPRIFVCRCEDVIHEEIEHAISLGLTTIEEIKRYTGLGTGPCQGKECLAVLAAYLVRTGRAQANQVQPFTARPPAEDVTFGALAAARRAPDGDPDPEPSPGGTSNRGGTA